jgi:tetratricopeptide (TPR) repeat protein
VAAAPDERGSAASSDTAVSDFDAASATGDDSADAAARAAFAAGLEASRAERWADAEREFRRSVSLVRRQSTLYNLALSLYMQRRFRECLAVLDQVLRTNDRSGDPRYAEYASKLLQRVRSESSIVRLVVSPPNAHVRVDGETARETGAERTLEVVPGTHDAEVAAPQYVTQHIALETTAGVDLERSVTLAHAEVDAPPEIRARTQGESPTSASFMVTTAPWIAVGLGGALLAAGAVTGVLALKADDELAQKCPSTRNCDPSLRSDQDRVVALGRATDALLVSGGVFLAGGVAWRLLVPVPATNANVRVLFLGATGRF